MINRGEVIAAVAGYFLNISSREEATVVVILNFSSLATTAGGQTSNEGDAS